MMMENISYSNRNASRPSSREQGRGMGAKKRKPSRMAGHSQDYDDDLPKTGYKGRMPHLPRIHPIIKSCSDGSTRDVSSPSSPSSHQKSEEDSAEAGDLLGPPYVNVLGDIHTRSEACSIRTVYNYEDKYRFSRILPSDSLLFDSHFESGNLRMAHRLMSSPTGAVMMDERANSAGSGGGSGSSSSIYHQDYDLILHNDLLSNGHVQWYYFSVANTVAGRSIRFNIINMSKYESLYTQGMQPLFFSQHAAAHQGEGWRRCGESIKYMPTDPKLYVRLSGHLTKNDVKDPKGQGLYTLSFTVTFEISNDTCYFAYCYPYTYSDLHQHLDQLVIDQQSSKHVRRSLLCRTLAGNRCEVLTITSPSSNAAAMLARPGIILTSRVHPGESNANYVMKGIIDFLASSHPKAKALRDGYVIKIVPMLNPDGVINGNYRTSLAGDDLNRRWDQPDQVLHPTIWWTKKLIEDMIRVRPVTLVVDLHGHSRREGVFMYGCIPDQKQIQVAREREALTQQQSTFDQVLLEQRVRLFPEIMSQACPSYFSPSSCSYRMHKSKASTMRIVMHNSHPEVCNTYTLETSLGGFQGRQFSQKDLEKIGVGFCLSMLKFAARLPYLMNQGQRGGEEQEGPPLSSCHATASLPSPAAYLFRDSIETLRQCSTQVTRRDDNDESASCFDDKIMSPSTSCPSENDDISVKFEEEGGEPDCTNTDDKLKIAEEVEKRSDCPADDIIKIAEEVEEDFAEYATIGAAEEAMDGLIICRLPPPSLSMPLRIISVDKKTPAAAIEQSSGSAAKQLTKTPAAAVVAQGSSSEANKQSRRKKGEGIEDFSGSDSDPSGGILDDRERARRLKRAGLSGPAKELLERVRMLAIERRRQKASKASSHQPWLVSSTKGRHRERRAILAAAGEGKKEDKTAAAAASPKASGQGTPGPAAQGMILIKPLSRADLLTTRPLSHHEIAAWQQGNDDNDSENAIVSRPSEPATSFLAEAAEEAGGEGVTQQAALNQPGMAMLRSKRMPRKRMHQQQQQQQHYQTIIGPPSRPEVEEEGDDTRNDVEEENDGAAADMTIPSQAFFSAPTRHPSSAAEQITRPSDPVAAASLSLLPVIRNQDTCTISLKVALPQARSSNNQEDDHEEDDLAAAASSPFQHSSSRFADLFSLPAAAGATFSSSAAGGGRGGEGDKVRKKGVSIKKLKSRNTESLIVAEPPTAADFGLIPKPALPREARGGGKKKHRKGHRKSSSTSSLPSTTHRGTKKR